MNSTLTTGFLYSTLPAADERHADSSDLGRIEPTYSQALGPPPLVLVVEDHADTLAMLACWLQHSGFRVAEAATASHAIRILSDTLPDIVTADIGLPDMDGLEFCRRLRQHPVAHSTPAIALTGWAMASDVQRARDAGFDSVLVKPCMPELLVEEIVRLLPAIPHSAARVKAR